MAGIIDFGITEKVIIDIEKVFKKYDMNIEEKQLIINKLSSRVMLQLQKQHSQDLINSMPLGGLVNRFVKKQEQGDDEDGNV